MSSVVAVAVVAATVVVPAGIVARLPEAAEEVYHLLAQEQHCKLLEVWTDHQPCA